MHTAALATTAIFILVLIKTDWLWTHLEKNENAQGEYYLTDLIQMAVDGGELIATIQIDPKEALGINTKEQLALCKEFTKQT